MMEDDNKYIDDLFKDGLGSYTETPPPAVWGALEKRLDGKKDKRRFIFGRFWPLAIVAFILVLGGGGTLAWKLAGNASVPSAGNSNNTTDNAEKLVARNASPAEKTEALKEDTKTPKNIPDQKPITTSNNKPAKKAHSRNNKIGNGTEKQNVKIDRAAILAKADNNIPDKQNGKDITATSANIGNEAKASGPNPAIASTPTEDNEKTASKPTTAEHKKVSQNKVAKVTEPKGVKTPVIKDEKAINTDESKLLANNVKTVKPANTANTSQPLNVLQASVSGGSARHAKHTKDSSLKASVQSKNTASELTAKDNTKVLTDVKDNASSIAKEEAKVATPKAAVAKQKKGKDPIAQAANDRKDTPKDIIANTSRAKKNVVDNNTKATTSTDQLATSKKVASLSPVKKSIKHNTTEAKTEQSTQSSATILAQPVAVNVPVKSKPIKQNKAATVAIQPASAATAPTESRDIKKVEPQSAPTEKATIAKKQIAQKEAKTDAQTEKKIVKSKMSEKAPEKDVPVVVAKNEVKVLEKETKQVVPENKTITKNNYGSSAQKIAAKEVPAENKIDAINPKPEEQKAVSTFKEDKPAIVAANPTNAGDSIKTPEAKRNLFEAINNSNRYEEGIKAGFEGGSNGAARKLVLSAYLQYNLNSRFSLMLQPAFKTSFASNKPLSGSQSFYRPNSDSSVKASTTDPIIVITPESQFDTILWTKTYTYSQTHDSLVKTYVAGGTYLEMELPILLKYRLSNKLSVYGGVNVTYGKTVGITEKTFTSQHILKTADTVVIWPFGGSTPPPQSVSSMIKYSGSPISSYSGPLYPSQSGDLWRFGFTLGFSYEFRKRWLFDVLVQQSTAKSNVQGGYDINSPLTLPYFRVTLGYKLGNFPIPIFH